MSHVARENQTAQHAEAVRRFWDDRARRFGSHQRATLGETYLRDVEIRCMHAHLRRLQPQRALDAGCGNGYSTKIYAHALPTTRFTGIDFSEQMLNYADKDRPDNCAFAFADVTDPATLPEGPFDAIYTQRCIQNLPDWDTQRAAIRNLLHRKTRDGVLILNECSQDGVVQLNSVRNRLGLKPIEGIEPWHNCFMIDAKLREEFDARVEHISSTYMLLVKVIHGRLGRWARRLPTVAHFGYDRFYVIR